MAAAVLASSAAKYRHSFDNTSLPEAFLQIERQHPEIKLNFIFNQLEHYTTSAKIDTSDPAKALKAIVGENPVYVARRGDTFFIEAYQTGRYTANGRAVGDDGEPVAFANIMLLTPNDSTLVSYGLTDERGEFHIPVDRASTIAKVNSVSHVTTFKASATPDFGTILVPHKTINLKKFNVNAERIVRKGQDLTLYPSRKDKRFASGGLDVIENMNVPELDVDPMTREVKGMNGETASFFVDYLPATPQQVREIRPQDIERIDVFSSPSDPRFKDARVAVNFIMKKYEYGGYTKIDGDENFLPRPYMGDYSVYTKMSYKKMTYDVSAGLGYLNYGDEVGNDEKTVYRFSAGTVERHAVTEGYKMRRLTPRVSARAVYNDKGIQVSNLVGFTFSGINPRNSHERVTYSDIFKSSSAFQKASFYNRGVSWNGDCYLPLPGRQSLNIDGSFNYSHNNNRSVYDLEGYDPILNAVTENAEEMYAGLGYTKHLGAQSLTARLGSGYSHNKLDYLSRSVTAVEYKEVFGQLRLEAALEFKGFSIRPSFTINCSRDELNGKPRTTWFPKTFTPFYLQLTRKSSVSGSFEYYKGDHFVSNKSPVLVRANEIYAFRGNENIKLFNGYVARLGYSFYFGPWLSMRAQAQMERQDHFLIPEYSEETSEEGTPMMVRNMKMDGTFTNSRFTLTLTGNYFENKLRLRLNGGARYIAQRGEIRLDKWVPMFNGSATYYIGNFRINAYYTIPTRNYMSYSRYRNRHYLTISGSWSWKDLYVTAMISNPFVKSYLYDREILDSPKFSSWTTENYPGYHQQVRVTVSYSFSYGKKVNRQDEVGEVSGAQSIILKAK